VDTPNVELESVRGSCMTFTLQDSVNEWFPGCPGW
jgi:hypothetical protein